MARITAHTDLNSATEYVVSLAGKTIQLLVAGNLSAGSANGVDVVAVFSAIEDYWKTNATANRYRFPLAMVDGPIGTMMELRGGWEWADATTISLLRNGGFAYTSDYAGSTKTAEYFCPYMLGTVKTATDQPYYLLSSDTTPTNFGVADEFNECIQVYGDASHGNFDKRDGAKFFVRTAGDTYLGYDLFAEQSISASTYRSYAIPGSTVTDAGVSDTSPSGSPYSGMTLTIGATTNTINSTSYNFAEGEIDANGGTVQEIYNWFQWLLKQTSNIDSGAGTQRGDTYLGGSLSFSGGIITTSQGLTIKNEATADASNIIHVDDTGTGRQEAVTATASVTDMPTAAGAKTRLQLANITATTASAWQASTAYSLGDKVLRTTGLGSESTSGLYMVCTTAGTSNDTEPTWDTTVGNTTADTNGTGAGDVVWTTYAVLFYDDDPASDSYSTTYTNGEQFASGDSVRMRFSELDAGTTFKIDQQTAISSTSGFSFAVSTTADDVYATNGVDGSATTQFTANFSSLYIALTADTDFTAAQAFAYYCYTLTLSAGMASFWGGVTAIDTGNYRINHTILNLYFDESVGAFVKQTDSARIFRTDGARPALDPTTGGYGLEVNWKLPVYAYDGGGGGFTSSDRAVLAALPSASDVVDEWEAQSQTDPTGFQVNVKELNDTALNGTGTSADKWRGS